MTAPKGHSGYSTPKQRKQERDHIVWVDEVFNEFKSQDDRWEKRKYITVAEIIGEENVVFARRKDGSSNQIESDGGIIFWDNILLGVCEDKYQTNFQNACERGCKYQVYFNLKPNQIFLSVGGKGFEFDLEEGSGLSTGTFYDMVKYRGYSIAINETEDQFKTRLRVWFNTLRSIAGV